MPNWLWQQGLAMRGIQSKLPECWWADTGSSTNPKRKFLSYLLSPQMSILKIADELSERLIKIFLKAEDASVHLQRTIYRSMFFLSTAFLLFAFCFSPLAFCLCFCFLLVAFCLLLCFWLCYRSCSLLFAVSFLLLCLAACDLLQLAGSR